MLDRALRPCRCKAPVTWCTASGLRHCRHPRSKRACQPRAEINVDASSLGLVRAAGAQTHVRSAKNEEAVRQAAKAGKSSWTAKEAGAVEGTTADYLSELGKAEYNINVDHGAGLQVSDETMVSLGPFLSFVCVQNIHV
jgi:hypothetical protein